MKIDNIKIYCKDNSELAEFEASSRGCRSDIYIEISNEFYHVNVYDIIRLQQDFETEIEYYGFYGIEPNVILVKEVKLENIKQTIKELFAQKYFQKIKPIDNKELEIKEAIEI